jgi:hypothetical protein
MRWKKSIGSLTYMDCFNVADARWFGRPKSQNTNLYSLVRMPFAHVVRVRKIRGVMEEFEDDSIECENDSCVLGNCTHYIDLKQFDIK